MNRSRFKRLAVRILLVVVGLWLLAAAGLGLAYLRYGWHRLKPMATPETPLAAAFRPYAEHGEILGEAGWPYVLRVGGARGGAVLFFGSGHTRNPHDPQIDRIIELWDAFHPTIALCESRLGLYVGGLRRGVSMFGEVGAPYALARRDDVPVYTLEPSWEDEIGAMLQRFPPQEVAALYTLRIFMSERGDRSGAELDALAAGLLKKRTSLPGLEGTFPDLAAFDAWWDATLREDVGDWRTLPERAMWPGVKDETLLTRLANASNHVRDEHITRLLIDLAGKGERVFVVCGGSHALTIEPALRAGLEAAS